jgi:hypothetical protein
MHRKEISTTSYTRFNNASTNLAHVQGIIVTTTAIGIGVDKGRIFPCLGEATIVEENVAFFEL